MTKEDFLNPDPDSVRVVTSLYGNPLHSGHVRLIEESAKLGDELVVIVNNDKQVALKGSIPFMSEQERLYIVSMIKGVDYAILSIDDDETVCESLLLVQPLICAKGGDRHEKTMNKKEIKTCDSIGCRIIYGVGGRDKIQSSSELLRKVREC